MEYTSLARKLVKMKRDYFYYKFLQALREESITTDTEANQIHHMAHKLLDEVKTSDKLIEVALKEYFDYKAVEIIPNAELGSLRMLIELAIRRDFKTNLDKYLEGASHSHTNLIFKIEYEDFNYNYIADTSYTITEMYSLVLDDLMGKLSRETRKKRRALYLEIYCVVNLTLNKYENDWKGGKRQL
jgi:hypothetical protein